MKHLNAMYVCDFLKTNGERGRGNGLTVASYLSQHLAANAKRYMRGYHHRLKHNLELAVESGHAELGESRLNRSTYYPTDKFIQLEM